MDNISNDFMVNRFYFIFNLRSKDQKILADFGNNHQTCLQEWTSIWRRKALTFILTHQTASTY
tara:strand:+ start:415 stop:603 length:189 start_codon:yes stop_codon:yes gene_type:complete